MSTSHHFETIPTIPDKYAYIRKFKPSVRHPISLGGALLCHPPTKQNGTRSMYMLLVCRPASHICM